MSCETQEFAERETPEESCPLNGCHWGGRRDPFLARKSPFFTLHPYKLPKSVFDIGPRFLSFGALEPLALVAFKIVIFVSEKTPAFVTRKAKSLSPMRGLDQQSLRKAERLQHIYRFQLVIECLYFANDCTSQVSIEI